MDAVVSRLPVLILSPHSRCNCRCVMCDIWKTTESREMSVADLARHLDSIEQLGVEWVVFSGGEPLMHSDLFRLCAPLKERGIRLTLLSTGILLERRAADIVTWFDDVIVSLDGPPAVHNLIRGVPSAFALLERGIQAVRNVSPDFPSPRAVPCRNSTAAFWMDTAVERARAAGTRRNLLSRRGHGIGSF